MYIWSNKLVWFYSSQVTQSQNMAPVCYFEFVFVTTVTIKMLCLHGAHNIWQLNEVTFMCVNNILVKRKTRNEGIGSLSWTIHMDGGGTETFSASPVFVSKFNYQIHVWNHKIFTHLNLSIPYDPLCGNMRSANKLLLTHFQTISEPAQQSVSSWQHWKHIFSKFT